MSGRENITPRPLSTALDERYKYFGGKKVCNDIHNMVTIVERRNV